jgi:aspartyl/asparaginyl-tRNA synthetase
MPFGEDLHRDAEAALCRWFGDVPFFITHLPASLKPFNARRDPDDPTQTLSVEYVAPYAGETMDGTVREPDAEVMRLQLEQSDQLRLLLARATAFAAQQAAATRGKDRPDPELLAKRNRAAVRRAYAAYLADYARAPLPRGGFALGVARLLQYLQGLDSIKDAVVNPTDRTTFASAGDGADEDADSCAGGAVIA